MNARRILAIVVLLVAALFGTRLVGGGHAPAADAPSRQAPSTRTAPWDRQAPAERPAGDAGAQAGGDAVAEADADGGAAAGELLVRDVSVRDMDGRVAWRGDVDLAPVLARIDAGEGDPHRNDGSVFGNREGLLPRRPDGYYREYVIRTPGIEHAGPQRLIVGADGELYYTSDHYASFRRIR